MTTTNTIATTWDGTEIDIARCEKLHGTVKSDSGEIVYLTQDAYLSHDGDMQPIYEANGVDAAGNQYDIAWEITNTETDDAGDACEWDRPYSVTLRESVE